MASLAHSLDTLNIDIQVQETDLLIKRKIQSMTEVSTAPTAASYLRGHKGSKG